MARILVCDDSDFMRQTIVGILQKGGHEVAGEAKSEHEARRKDSRSLSRISSLWIYL